VAHTSRPGNEAHDRQDQAIRPRGVAAVVAIDVIMGTLSVGGSLNSLATGWQPTLSADRRYLQIQDCLPLRIGMSKIASGLLWSSQACGTTPTEHHATTRSYGTEGGQPSRPSPVVTCTFVYPLSDSSDLARTLTGGSTSMVTTMSSEPTNSATSAVLKPEPVPISKDAHACLHIQRAEHTRDDFGRRSLMELVSLVVQAELRSIDRSEGDIETVGEMETNFAHSTSEGTRRGGSSAREPRPRRRRNAAVVTRNEGLPRPPNRGSSAMKPRASKVSITPLLSVARVAGQGTRQRRRPPSASDMLVMVVSSGVTQRPSGKPNWPRTASARPMRCWTRWTFYSGPRSTPVPRAGCLAPARLATSIPPAPDRATPGRRAPRNLGTTRHAVPVWRLLLRLHQGLFRVLPNDLQQPVAPLRAVVGRYHIRPVHQRGEQRQHLIRPTIIAGANCLRRLDCEASDEDGQSAKQRALSRGARSSKLQAIAARSVRWRCGRSRAPGDAEAGLRMAGAMRSLWWDGPGHACATKYSLDKIASAQRVS